jgi:glutamate-ammonia-ligase adenylyltransferase
VARAAGAGPDVDPGQFLDDYRRTTRRARTVVEQVFYGRPAG